VLQEADRADLHPVAVYLNESTKATANAAATTKPTTKSLVEVPGVEQEAPMQEEATPTGQHRNTLTATFLANPPIVKREVHEETRVKDVRVVHLVVCAAELEDGRASDVKDLVVMGKIGRDMR